MVPNYLYVSGNSPHNYLEKAKNRIYTWKEPEKIPNFQQQVQTTGYLVRHPFANKLLIYALELSNFLIVAT
jgi:hypothetical protein